MAARLAALGLAGTVLLGVAAGAQANCSVRSGNVAATPDGAFTDNGNGTVTHTTTGLVWKKCPEGRTYSGGNCTGSTGTYTWQAALRRAVSDTTAGQTDWRLPSRTELLSIVETGCSLPTINTDLFPNVPTSGVFWSSTHAGSVQGDSAWAVRFNTGATLLMTKSSPAFARLVRSGNTAHDTYAAAVPTEPNAFSFVTQTVGVGETALSNTVTMTGLTASRPISIVGGEYRINAGTWTTASGNIANGNTLQLRLVAPFTMPSTISATVNVNGRTATFVVNTGNVPPDTTPDAFSFVDQTGVALSTTITSAAITVEGINTPTSISVTGGQFEINGNNTWIDPGTGGVTVNNGDTVKVRHTSSAGYTTAVNTVLTIGGVSDTFTSTTAALDTTPDAFSFTDQTGVALSTLITSNAVTISGINGPATVSALSAGGAYEVNNSGTWISVTGGTVSNGNTVKVRHTSSASYTTAVNTTITIGGVSDTFSSTTAALDTTPDAFSFVDQPDVARSATITSAAITVAGINGPASISVSGGEYEKNNSGTWTSAAGGTVVNGDTVRVRHTSSANYSTTTNTTLTIGGVSDIFSSTTLAEPGDTIPDAFSFVDQTNVALSTTITSAAINVTGISAATDMTLTGGHLYDKNLSGSFVSCPAPPTVCTTVVNGDQIRVRHTSSASFSTVVNSVVTIGGVSDTFSSTTVAQDTTPDAFAFTDLTGVELSTLTASNAVTISGINSPATVSALTAGHAYEVNGSGTWITTTGGTVSNGNTVKVRHTSSASSNTAVNTAITIGGVSDTFTTTTGDATPDAFVFTDQTDVATSTLTESNAITVTGINISAPISVTGGEYQINGGTWTSAAGSVANGNTVKVRHTSSASASTTVNTTLTIGGVSDIFSTTTLSCSLAVWQAVSYSDTTGNKSNNLTHPTVVTLTGICADTAASVTPTARFDISRNSTSTWADNLTLQPGDVLRVRFVQNNNRATFTATITVGGVSKTWAHTTD